MNKAIVTTLIVVAIVALAGGLFFFGAVYGRNLAFRLAGDPGYNAQSFWGPGMMAGRGGGYGMMGQRGGYGMMGGRGGYGMMNGFGYNNAGASPLSVEQAKAAAEKYLAAVNNKDLAVAEVMIFDNNAYVAVKETSTGRGAFELLVDSGSQVAYPEHGPNMMWNTKYGALNHTQMMSGFGGMMGQGGPWSGAPSGSDASMTVTAQQAVERAQEYLDSRLPGTLAAKDPLEFYGYYTLDYSKDGKVAGMLSVNGYTGQVFLHTWHGTFIQEAE